MHRTITPVIEFWPSEMGPDDECRNPPTALCIVHLGWYMAESLVTVAEEEHRYTLRETDRACEECLECEARDGGN